MTQARKKAMRQYVVYHLKFIELLHIWLMSFHFPGTKTAPENVMGHNSDRFVETLLGLQANAFLAITDNSSSTNIRDIWKILFPAHARAIDRIWEKRIQPGHSQMKAFRDQAGAHGDKPEKYFSGKLRLLQNHEQVVTALDTFIRLSGCLLKKQEKEIPEMSSEIESALLDIELSLGTAFPGGFNREWLRKMHLIESGPFTKRYP